MRKLIGQTILILLQSKITLSYFMPERSIPKIMDHVSGC